MAGDTKGKKGKWQKKVRKSLTWALVMASLAPAGAITAAEINADAHHCEPQVVVIHTSTKGTNGKTSTTTTTERKSCPAR
jgi:hypothetical protein